MNRKRNLIFICKSQLTENSSNLTVQHQVHQNNPVIRTNNPLTLLVVSVTATFILDLIVSGSSNKYIQLFWSLSDFDIFFSGWRKLLIRRLDSSVTRTVSGIGNNLDLNLLLNLLAIFRVSSTFCSWSSPTGTLVALYSSISAAYRNNNLRFVIRFSEQQHQKNPFFTCSYCS